MEGQASGRPKAAPKRPVLNLGRPSVSHSARSECWLGQEQRARLSRA